MIDNKNISKIVLVLMAAAVVCLLVFMIAHAGAGSGNGFSMDYESTLFDMSQTIEINIDMDESQWEQLLATATYEEYYTCDVTVNGTTYKNVGIRPKGNTSLTMVASSDSDRYSFKLKFDEYVDNQTCDGLSKLVLNNNYADATMMKEAVIYDMFDYLGADASLYNYAKVSVNGEYFGLYLALEAVEEEFALRNYGSSYGQLYKPDSMEMGGAGKMKDFDADDVKDMLRFSDDEQSDQNSGDFRIPDGVPPGQMPEDFSPGQMPEDFSPDQLPEGMKNFAPGQMPAMSGEGIPDMGKRPDMTEGRPDRDGGFDKGKDFGDGRSGSTSLNYIDDDISSYSAIWNSSVFQSTAGDHQRVVTALKNICAGDVSLETLNEYMDVDNMLRYMAVHTFAVNLDSLSGNMAHNYYLYEEDGKLNIIPWDYNLAFGGFQSGDAVSTINFPVDTPFSKGIDMNESRKIFAALLNNKECLDQYHEYLRILAQEYVGGGHFAQTYTTIRSQIDNLVAEDPTAFFTYEEYEVGANMLVETIKLRAESICGQLDGTVPSSHTAQAENPGALIDCSSININAMGSMMGGGFGGDRGNRGVRQNRGDGYDSVGSPIPDMDNSKSVQKPLTQIP